MLRYFKDFKFNPLHNTLRNITNIYKVKIYNYVIKLISSI